MKMYLLEKQNIHTGNLILVNREYGYTNTISRSLIPVHDHVPSVLLEQRAVVLLSALMKEIQGWDNIVPVSGWRSLQEQQELWDSSLAENGKEFTEKYVAFPGHSEHQTGLAIDLGLKKPDIDFIRPDFPYTGICQTFREHAAEYGFIERYPSGKEAVTGIGHEPWHFRYVGVPHAQIMAAEGLVLEEYSSFIRQFPYGQKPYCIRKGTQNITVSFLKAGAGGCTELEIDEQMPYSISGNNIDGFIITQWKASQ